VKPDIVHDLNIIPLPFDDNSFDEIHAYQVLEHCGTQGDYKFFFAQFEDFWRILKPNGFLCASVPAWNGPWAWGDPGHKRVIPYESLIFLDQEEYKQVGTTSICDYRWCYKGNLERIETRYTEDGLNFVFVLRAVKE
jgi:predicted SAM-dependent methyltransferase